MNTEALFDTPISRKNSDSLKWEKYDGDILPMWVADMDFAVAEPIQSALLERMQHPVYGYTIPNDRLISAIQAHLLTEYGWAIKPEWLVFLPGVVTGLAISCRAFCADDDEVMVNPPIYHHFYDSHEGKRQTLKKVPLHIVDGRWTYDIESMKAACSDKLSMIMMCSPHNPTGTVFTKDELMQVGKMCADNNMMMISDEIHCDLVIDNRVKHMPTAVACPDYADSIVTLMSASKTFNIAGLNASFAIISNESVREQFKETCKSVVSPVPPLALVATEAAYAHGGEWRNALLNYLKANYQHIENRLASIPSLSLQPLQATYLAWIDASDLGLDDVQAHFEQFGLGLSGGQQFGQPNFVRLNFACPRSVLDEGLQRLQKAVDAVT